MTRFFPITDAIEINRKRLRRIVEDADFDMSEGVYIANEEMFCGKCKEPIKKYTPCYVEFYYRSEVNLKGMWSIGLVRCLECATSRLRYKKVKHWKI